MDNWWVPTIGSILVARLYPSLVLFYFPPSFALESLL